ncbi:MAG: glycerol-3-phosphate 1-O-acyltransferase PlsY [Gemmatimonadota bacterium]|nr:glycerol-3-phosphate 1-O-acyltransferase PlsY [Gemmatimonadota bacterium]
MTLALALALAYLAGSIPTSFLVGRAWGVDPGEKGSGNYGATNVFRTLGVVPALLVIVVDIGKGAAPVLLLPGWLPTDAVSPTAYGVLLAVAAVLGHVYSLFLGFRGGKGIGTAAGAYAVLAPWALLVAAIVWVGLVAWRRIVSLASLGGTVALLAAVVALRGDEWPESWPLIAVTAALAAFVAWTHRENIERLRSGAEKPIAPGSAGERG